MSIPETSVIARYFEADARRDIDAIVALFSDEAVVVDEGQTYHGPKEIRGWRKVSHPCISTPPRSMTPGV